MNKKRWLGIVGWLVPVLTAFVVWVWWSHKRRRVAQPERIELDISNQEKDHISFAPQTTRKKEWQVDTSSLQEQECAPDDLTKIEGIGPRISAALISAGVTTFADLAALRVDHLKEMLREAGIRIAYPDTWPEQADLAAQAKWDELDALQGELVRGRRV